MIFRRYFDSLVTAFHNTRANRSFTVLDFRWYSLRVGINFCPAGTSIKVQFVMLAARCVPVLREHSSDTLTLASGSRLCRVRGGVRAALLCKSRIQTNNTFPGSCQCYSTRRVKTYIGINR